MPEAVSTTIAKGITALISTATLSLPKVCERVYIPEFNVEEVNQLTVWVVDLADSMEEATREDDQFDYVIRVAILSPVPAKDPERITKLDALRYFRQQIIDLLRAEENRDQGGATLIEAVTIHTFDPNQLASNSVFYCNLTLTYRECR